MYTPQFPYLGNQAIISSGRVVVHSKDDFIFLFGKKGIGLSTPATVNLDVNERVIIASPKIELGYQAEARGESVLLGNKTVRQLSDLCDAIQALSAALAQLNPAAIEIAVPAIVQTSTVLASQAVTIKNQLNNNCLSKTTYTL